MIAPRSTLTALSLALALTVPAAAPRAQAGPVKDLALDVKQELKALKAGMVQARVDLAQTLDQLGDDLKAGLIDAAQATDGLADALAAHHDGVAASLAAYAATVEQEASDSWQQAPLLTGAFLVGEGLLGGAVASADAQRLKATAKAGKLARRFGARVRKLSGHDLIVDQRAPELPAFTPADGPTPADAPAPSFRIDLLVSGGGVGVPGDGRLVVGGLADPAAGSEVTVTVTRPGSPPLVQVAAVDPLSGRWQAQLQGLQAGNHAVVASLGPVHLHDSLGVR